MRNTIHHGDSEVLLKSFPAESLDACVTDPPYGLGTRQPTGEEIDDYLRGGKLAHGGDFMGRDWSMPSVALWREVYRVLKPGAVLMAFAGPRTIDLMAAGILAAGFSYQNTLGWVYGSGFPKGQNISKAIDRMAGVEREVVGTKRGVGGENINDVVRGSDVRRTDDPGGKGLGAYGVGAKQVPVDVPVTAPATEDAKKWDGYGTQLKPAWEPILIFTKGETSFEMPAMPFLYQAKAAKTERHADGEVENNHVTVKPLGVMRWLVALATKNPESLVLDPFLGSGTTACACAEENRGYVGIELDPTFFALAQKRTGIVKGKADDYFVTRAGFDAMDELEQD